MKTNDTQGMMRRHRERKAASAPLVKVDKGAGRDAATVQRVKPKLSVWSKLKVLLFIKKLVSDPTMLNKLKSRKLWVSVGAAALAALGTQLGLDPATVTTAVTVLVAYVGGESLVDAARAHSGKELPPK